MQKTASSGEGVLRGLHVLVVDDDDAMCEILNSVLARSGALVTATGNAKEALRRLDEVCPDVVVADMLLGMSDGVVLLTQARKSRHLAPFIAMSGAELDPQKLERVGFMTYLRKPFEPATLVDAILSAARARGLEAAAARPGSVSV